MRFVKIFTFGCQMNEYDSNRMIENLSQLGYQATDKVADADLVILNTCSVREKPEHKVSSMIGRLNKLRTGGQDFILAVGGCMGKQHGEALLAAEPAVDLVFGPDQVGLVHELVARVATTGERLAATEQGASSEAFFIGGGTNPRQSPSGFVSIMKGCDQYCAYCIVPFVRGRETSRSPEAILEEIRRLGDQGVREVCLLGQNVNRYGLDQPNLPSFAGLLEKVHELPELKRLTFITSNPGDCPEELIAAFRNLPKLNSQFHLPMQSGSDRILKLMNRRYDRARYLDLVARLREARPDLHISTDIIVGFPTETDRDFAETMSAAEEIRWGSSFSFRYSPRPGTVAASMPDDVPLTVKQERLASLQELLFSTMIEALEAHVDRTVEVMVHGPSKLGDGQLTGKTRTGYIVNFSVPQPGLAHSPAAGDLVQVRIDQACKHSLVGRMTPVDDLKSQSGGQECLPS